MEQRLGKYIIQEQLGEGSFAYVYRAFDEDLERHIALKVLKPVWLSDPQAIKRFKQEARTMAKLNHPHIAVIYDVGETEGQVYLAQFLVEGETLADRLVRGSLSWPEIITLLQPIASALDYAHGQGMVHRDIKPSNILLGKSGQVYLGDFGLVRAAEGSASLSASVGGVKGTASYIPPEVWEGEEATRFSDVYALSCVIFEMLTGNVLFEGSSMMTVMRKHDKGPQFPETWPKNVPNGITAVLQRGLAANPAERWSSAGELLAALVALRASSPPLPSPPIPAPLGPSWFDRFKLAAGPLWAKALQKKWPVAVAVVVIFCILLYAGYAWLVRTPDNAGLAFASDRTGNWEIYALDKNGEPQQMTNNPGIDIEPAWTLFGSSLAFASDRDGDWDIYVLDSSGDTIRMTNDGASDREPAWSPLGSNLAFASDRDGDWDIYTLGMDGEAIPMTNNNASDREPAWSQFGANLTFASDRDGNWEIYVLDSSGETTRMTNDSASDREPAWSPLDSGLAFASDRDGDWDIYILGMDGVARRITNNRADDRSPVWSPDGKQIAFESNLDGTPQIYVMDSDGGNIVQLTDGNATSGYPAWAP